MKIGNLTKKTKIQLLLIAAGSISIGSSLYYVQKYTKYAFEQKHIAEKVGRYSEGRLGPLLDPQSFFAETKKLWEQFMHTVERYVLFQGALVGDPTNVLVLLSLHHKMDQRFIFDTLQFNNIEIIAESNLRFKAYKSFKEPEAVILIFNPNMLSILQFDFPVYLPREVQENADIYWLEYPGFAAHKDHSFDTEADFLGYIQSFYEHLKRQGAFEGKKVIVSGYSMGGAPSLYLASTYSDEIDGIILISTYARIKDVVSNTVRSWVGPYLISWMQFELPNTEWMKKVKCPAILFHGIEDDLIPISQGEELYEAYKKNIKGDIEFHKVPHYNHANIFGYTHDVRDEETGKKKGGYFIMQYLKRIRSNKKR